jgi:transcriptional regulator with XRE-family HTH domain
MGRTVVTQNGYRKRRMLVGCPATSLSTIYELMEVIYETVRLYGMNPIDFGKRFVRLRRARGFISRGQCASYLGIEKPTMARWERGETYPDHRRFPVLCRDLCCTLDFLFFGDTTAMPASTMRLLAALDEQDEAQAASGVRGGNDCCDGECRCP